MPKTRPPYSPEFRRQMVDLVRAGRVLRVSKAGYYAWLQRPPCAHVEADATLLKRVRTIHVSSRQTYGAPRVHADLRTHEERHGRNGSTGSP